MSENIKISVIVPIYNVEKYLEASLDSVVKQSLKEIEIICINDGSTDNSLKIAEEFARRDKRVKVIDKKNEGVSAARNAGLAVATGEYLHCLDSDDLIREETYEELYNLAKQNDLDSIYFDADSFFENKVMEEKEQNYHTYYHRNTVYNGVYTGQEMFTEMIENWDFKPSVCLQLIRRELILQNDIKFYYGIIHEDNLFTLESILLVQRTMHTNKCYYKRVVHEGSIMTTDKGFKNAWGYYICCKEIFKFITQIKLTDACILALQQYTFRMYNSAMMCLTNIEREYIWEKLCNYSLDDAMSFMVNIYDQAEKQRIVQNRITVLEKKCKHLSQEVYDCRHCNSYKIGRIITFLPRRIKNILQLIREKGVSYAWYRFLLKFSKRVRVSIIIPVYNTENYLRESLDCLLNQTLKQIEIICIDDGSSDNSLEILKEYKQKDSRIKILKQHNQGAGIARNCGLKSATGEYVIFLDADDMFDAELCNLAYYKSRKVKADICLYAAKRFDMKNKKTEPMNWVLRYDELPKKLFFSSEEVRNRIFQITTACPWSKMFRRKFILENNLKFQPLKNSNDVFFVRAACALAKKITALEQSLITYRWNEGNNTQSLKDSAPVEFYKAFKELKTQLIARGIFEVFEQSYVNMVLTESLHNLKTVKKEESQKIIVDLMLREGFDFFEFEKYDSTYFYNHKEYEKYCKMLKYESERN